jgi:hypothetical protein
MQAKHIKGTVSLCAALIAGVALFAASGAGAAKPRAVTKIDVSTKAAVVHYLRSIHVNPKGVVIQRGARNYAGPNCPGKRWSCASTLRTVVQIARAGGKNIFKCRTAHCSVLQISKDALSTNTAKCVKTSGLNQSCSINQTSTSANNQAIVVENTSKMTGLTQSASLAAQITQRAGTGANTACVKQIATIDGSTVAKKGTPVNVNLAAHQTITIKQDSTSGGNTINVPNVGGTACQSGDLIQTQALSSTANGSGPITQNQNAVDSGANLTLDIAQNQSSGFFGAAHGVNNASFHQTNQLTAIASTPTGAVNQTQSSANGGILATINQYTGTNASDTSIANATQTETQCEDASKVALTACADTPDSDPLPSSLTQTQFGPVRKGAGDSIQTGGNGDVFNVTQSSKQNNDKQNNDTGNNQTNLIHGDCTTDGTCTVTQTTDINGVQNTNTATGQEVDTQTTCTDSACTSTGPTTTGDLTLLPNGLSVSNADIGEFGDGGMREAGTGSITVMGVDGPVLHAFLYWHGPTTSDASATANANVTFDGNAVVGTNIGTADDNNWPGFQDSQSYRADVTGLVTGNGTYSLANFTKPDADINGVALIVFHDDGNSANDRTAVLWNGNDSNVASTFDAANWDETVSGVPYPGSGSATLDFVVGDGQSRTDAALIVNGTTIAPAGSVFDGNTGPNYAGNGEGVTGSLWDMKSFNITSLLTSGSNDLRVTSGTAGDALSLVVALANVPASAPVILGPAVAASQHAATAEAQTAPARASRASGPGATR